MTPGNVKVLSNKEARDVLSSDPMGFFRSTVAIGCRSEPSKGFTLYAEGINEASDSSETRYNNDAHFVSKIVAVKCEMGSFALIVTSDKDDGILATTMWDSVDKAKIKYPLHGHFRVLCAIPDRTAFAYLIANGNIVEFGNKIKSAEGDYQEVKDWQVARYLGPQGETLQLVAITRKGECHIANMVTSKITSSKSTDWDFNRLWAGDGIKVTGAVTVPRAKDVEIIMATNKGLRLSNREIIRGTQHQDVSTINASSDENTVFYRSGQMMYRFHFTDQGAIDGPIDLSNARLPECQDFRILAGCNLVDPETKNPAIILSGWDKNPTQKGKITHLTRFVPISGTATTTPYASI